MEDSANSVSKIKPKDLKVGMYVMLPSSWFKHPFLKNQFVIASEKEIEKIISSGFNLVLVDYSKSMIEEAQKSQPEQSEQKTAKIWKPEEIVPTELLSAVRSKDMPPKNKAVAVKNSSLVLMNRLLEDPSAANIKSAKQGIFEVVDCIMSEDEMSQHLLSITSHDVYTYTHSVNVGFLSLLLAKQIFKGSIIHNMRELGAGFFLHDLGKVNIDSSIINKPGKLDLEELSLIRRHPVEGAKMLAKTHQLSEEANIIVMQHHEREDGTGYPNELKGKQIHLYARICSIADVYDALTSERSYKKKLPPFEALRLMRNEMINHFQKDLFERFALVFVK